MSVSIPREQIEVLWKSTLVLTLKDFRDCKHWKEAALHNIKYTKRDIEYAARVIIIDEQGGEHMIKDRFPAEHYPHMLLPRIPRFDYSKG